MGTELVRNHVTVAFKSCGKFASRHPLLVFMVFVLIWIYRSFPLLFSLLLHASPVIASTLFLLGTLLFYGHENAPEMEKSGKPHHHEIHNPENRVMGDAEIGEDTYGVRSKSFSCFNNMNINDDHRLGTTDPVLVKGCAQFQPCVGKRYELKREINSRRNSFDTSHSALEHTDEDHTGWETGSDLVESSSPMADIFPMLDELHPLLESQVPHRTHMLNVSTDVASDHSLESGEMINETDDYYDDDDDDDDDEEEEEEDDIEFRDDEKENVITWTEDDERNLVNLGTSELERNQRLENLIARQKALKNMRMLAEKNMVNFTPGLPIPLARKNPFDLPYNSNENIHGSVVLPTSPFDLPYDPNGHKPDRVGPTFQNHETFDVGPSAKLGPYFVPGRVASDPEPVGVNHIKDDSSREAGWTDVKGHEEKTSSKSSSSSFFDTDDIYDRGADEEEEEYRSIDNSTMDSKENEDLSADQSASGDTKKGGLPQRSSQVHGLTSWLTRWKA